MSTISSSYTKVVQLFCVLQILMHLSSSLFPFWSLNTNNNHYCFTSVDATSSRAYAWGRDIEGTLGVCPFITNIVPSPKNIVNITTSYQYLKLSEGSAGYRTQYLLGSTDVKNSAPDLLGMGTEQYLPSFSSGNGGYTPKQMTPVPLFTIFGPNILYMSTSDFVSVAVTKDTAQNFTLYSWGDSNSGALGDGGSLSRGVVSTPVKVLIPSPCQKGLKQFAQTFQAFLLCQDFEQQYLYTYGPQYFRATSFPVGVDLTNFGGKTLVKVVPGYGFAVALTSDSSVFTTGSCVGSSEFIPISNLPLSTGDFIVDIAVANLHVFMLTNTSKIILFGRRTMELGIYFTDTLNCASIILTDMFNFGHNIRKIAASSSGFALVLSDSHNIYAIGSNEHGNLATGNTSAIYGPVLITNLTFSGAETVTELTANRYGSYVVISDEGPYCNKIPSFDLTVCSGNGQCVTQDYCLCKPGYFGRNCEDWTCFGKLKTSSSVCFSHGTCFELDRCNCTNRFTGDQCQTEIVNNNNQNATTAIAVGVTVPLAVIILLVVNVGIIICVLYKKFKKGGSNQSEDKDQKTVIEDLGQDAFYSHNNNTQGHLTDIEMNTCAISDPNFHHPKSLLNSEYTATLSTSPSRSIGIKDHHTPVSDFPSETSIHLTSIKASSLNSPSAHTVSVELDSITRYINLVRVGQGAFGSVFRGNDTKMGGKPKALKVVKFNSLSELNIALKEGAQLMNLNHPNILKVNDFFVDKDQVLCIDMDYYEKGDLSKLTSPKVECPEKIVKQIIYQICDALNFVHTHLKIIHRDVKPSNIFIDKMDRDQIHVILADFGLARANNNNNSYAGTPLFMSPELGLGGKYSFNTDVYSLGVTIYQIMTKDVATSISHLYFDEEYDAKQFLKDKLSESGIYYKELIDIVVNMLEKSSSKRPSAADIIKDPYFSDIHNCLLANYM